MHVVEKASPMPRHGRETDIPLKFSLFSMFWFIIAVEWSLSVIAKFSNLNKPATFGHGLSEE